MLHNPSSLGSRILPHNGWSRRYPLWLKAVCDSLKLANNQERLGSLQFVRLWYQRCVLYTFKQRQANKSSYQQVNTSNYSLLGKPGKSICFIFQFLLFSNLLYFIFLHSLCPVSISDKDNSGWWHFKYLQLWVLWHDFYNDNYTKNWHFISSFVSWDSQGFMSVFLFILTWEVWELSTAPEQEIWLCPFNWICIDSDTHILLFASIFLLC